MQKVHHLRVVFVFIGFKTEYLLISFVSFGLVEHAQNLVELVVYFAVQKRYLHNDAVVRQTIDERVAITMLNYPAVVVNSFTTHIDHCFIDVSYAVTQEINGNHRNGKPLILSFLLHVFLGIVLQGKIAAETESLCFYPRLLQLYQYQMHEAVVFSHCCRKVDSEH